MIWLDITRHESRWQVITFLLSQTSIAKTKNIASVFIIFFISGVRICPRDLTIFPRKGRFIYSLSQSFKLNASLLKIGIHFTGNQSNATFLILKRICLRNIPFRRHSLPIDIAWNAVFTYRTWVNLTPRRYARSSAGILPAVSAA